MFAGLPLSKKTLCWVYLAIAIAALFGTWSQNIFYLKSDTLTSPAYGLVYFVKDTWVNAAARSITIDIILFFLSASIWMVVESRKYRIRHVWAYIVFGCLVAISFTFPLFLIARELRVSRKS